MQELQQFGVTLWLDERGAHAQPAARLTPELKEQLRDLKSAVLQYLAEQGEEVVQTGEDSPVDDEERAHCDMRTLPRTPEEVDKQRADAERVREAGRRRYQGGQLRVMPPLTLVVT
jgi:hypothetical protein